MPTRLRTFTISIALVQALGCGDEPESNGPHAAANGAVFAVISSDFTATSISLLGANGEIVEDDYLNSGSARAGLVTALSGDVALPTVSGEQDTLVVIDRFKTDVITRIRLSDGKVLGQLKTHTPKAPGNNSTYSSDPHDYVYIDQTHAWVSRYEPNLDPGVPTLERGTDLLCLDPSASTRTSQRIDLSFLDTKGAHIDPDTMKESQVDVYARPSSIVRVGETLVVGLSRMSFDFSAIGPGEIAVVDLKAQKAIGLPLAGLSNCSTVVPVYGANDRVLVSCGGSFLADPREEAGIIELSVADGKAKIERSWKGKDHASDLLAISNPISLGGSLVGVVAFGTPASPATDEFPATKLVPDTFVLLDLATGKQQRMFESEGAYTLASGAYSPDEDMLLIPDASVDKNMRPTSGVRRLQRKDGKFTELSVIQVAKSSAMPVRQIAPL